MTRRLAVRVHFWSALVAGPLIVVLALSGAALVFAPEIDAATRPRGASPQRSIVAPIRSLHASLHAGRPGALVVGVLGVALVAEGVTGFWLYGRASLRGRASPRRPPAQRIHRVLGGVSLMFAAVVGLTGAALALTAAASAVDTPGVHDAVRRLHYGDFFGWPSRIVYAVAGATLPILSLTGYLLLARRAS